MNEEQEELFLKWLEWQVEGASSPAFLFQSKDMEIPKDQRKRCGDIFSSDDVRPINPLDLLPHQGIVWVSRYLPSFLIDKSAFIDWEGFNKEFSPLEGMFYPQVFTGMGFLQEGVTKYMKSEIVESQKMIGGRRGLDYSEKW